MPTATVTPAGAATNTFSEEEEEKEEHISIMVTKTFGARARCTVVTVMRTSHWCFYVGARAAYCFREAATFSLPDTLAEQPTIEIIGITPTQPQLR